MCARIRSLETFFRLIPGSQQPCNQNFAATQYFIQQSAFLTIRLVSPGPGPVRRLSLLVLACPWCNGFISYGKKNLKPLGQAIHNDESTYHMFLAASSAIAAEIGASLRISVPQEFESRTLELSLFLTTFSSSFECLCFWIASQTVQCQWRAGDFFRFNAHFQIGKDR